MKIKRNLKDAAFIVDRWNYTPLQLESLEEHGYIEKGANNYFVSTNRCDTIDVAFDVDARKYYTYVIVDDTLKIRVVI